ncbi:MAG: twin-arginine translocase TatA/TatE family subunit [Gemmatimonadota bacterium]|jgi:sec-independent protein translocase protein TatA
MGFGNLGIWEVMLILVVLLLVFGARRLPEIGSALGKGIREFKSSVRDIENDINRPQQSVGNGQPQDTLPQQRAEAAGPEAKQQPAQSQPRQDPESERAESGDTERS